MKRFDVTWSNSYEAEDFREAIEQALGDLADVVVDRRGPSIFTVYDDEGNRVAVHDIEHDSEV